MAYRGCVPFLKLSRNLASLLGEFTEHQNELIFYPYQSHTQSPEALCPVVGCQEILWLLID